MDLAAHHLPLAQATQPYGLEADLSSSSYGNPLEVPHISRSLSSGFGLQSSSLNQRSASNLSGEQPPWPLRVLNEVRDLFVLLSPDGRVMYVSPSCKPITGFDTMRLEQDQFSRFIHDDDKPVFTRELRECVATARTFRCHFRMYRVDNTTCLMEAQGHPHVSTVSNDGGQQQFCHGVFIVCRPYHTNSTQLLDSFLEHKLENIRLKERIAQLKKEEEDDLNAAAQQTKQSQPPSTAAHRPVPQTSNAFASNQGMPSSFGFSQDPAAISDENNESSDTMGIDEFDMSRAAAALSGEESHLNGIELITGLFLSEGERSQGISTGIPQSRLYHSTSESTSEQPTAPESEPRKRLKGEYQCADCGTSDSPEWRKGPDGPKTLCNACGLRWAKREKKRSAS
ncbi:hypothetical protein BJY04DRAFT_188391 [Aspergillus karnatakaensis]|uniref:GATA transcription factor LreB n=1 Tax=Aspergillus karnatakaensis TaxID=1810916 RepID=UPI003CCE3F00